MISSVACAIAYILLNAWTGLATCGVSLIRNIIFIIDEKKNGKREHINRTDVIVFSVACTLLMLSAIFTYDGFFSLFSIFATVVYTYSICQKKTKIYKLLGNPVSVCWIRYNIYVVSIFGIILESILLISAALGFILEAKKSDKELTDAE